MPSDIDSHRRRRAARNSAFPFTPVQIIVLFIIALCWSFASIHYHLPPYSWVDDFKHRHDKVVKHRPAFKKVDRYSPQHRYRPAASPIIKKVGKDGKIINHGQYH